MAAWKCAPTWLGLDERTPVKLLLAAGERSEDYSPHWLIAGFGSGHLSVLDARNGSAITAWQAHEETLTCADKVGEWGILTASKDKSIALWDLRRVHPGASAVQVFKGHKDAVSSMAVHQSNVLSVAGGRIGVTSLLTPPPPIEVGVLSPRDLAYSVPTPERLDPMRLRSQRGTKETAPMSSIRVVSNSHVFIVGTEDGNVKICN